MKYYVIGYVDATMSRFVEAGSPEEAIDEAGLSPSLCHQCSDEIECCDVYDWQVLDESQENVLIDSDASNQLRVMRERAEAAEAKLEALVESYDAWKRHGDPSTPFDLDAALRAARGES